MTLRTKKIGQWGEELAQNFLLKKGWILVKKNWTCSLGEIDLVFKKQKEIIFVEVKTRSTPFCGWAEDSVNYFKKKKLKEVIDFFLLNEKSFQNFYPRFDIVVVEIIKTQSQIIHYENVIIA